MLPIKSKHLTAQIITTTTLITITMLLSSTLPTIESLPITSKPIESTAENLAWEAWLMIPVGQQQKSRKVTPKSIFMVPQKKNQSSGSIQCQAGEHLFESRCVPTVKIDTDKILLTQLTNLVLTSVNYDYDYDEDGNDAPGAEKLEGGTDVIPLSNAADEPLKFDIFRDNFPIGSSGSGDSSGSKDSDDENIFFIGDRRRRPIDSGIPDLDTDSSSYGSHNQSVEDDVKEPEAESTLFLSGIDAILVPAISETQGKEQSLNFSIYQDLVNATMANNEMEILSPIAEKKVDLQQILKDESMFLDKNHEKDITTTEKSDDTTTDEFELETTTLRLIEDDDVESKTEFTRSVTDPTDEETTLSTTDSKEITSTVISEEDDITSTMIPSDDTTMVTEPKEEITTITNPKEDTTIISNSDLESQSTIDSSERTIRPEESTPGDRFIYHHLRDEIPLPPVIDISAELKMINDLVAKKRQIETIATPSAEEPAANLWTKIIQSPNSIATTTTMPVESSSRTSVRSSTSTNSNSSSSSSTTSSTDGQGSLIDPLAPTSSTSLEPVVAQSNPFWWLPTGWRVDRSDTDRPLLLRFWSALSGMSGSQTKV